MALAYFQDGSLGLPKKTISRFKQKVRERTRRNKPGTLESKIELLNQLLIGWISYFRLSRSRSEFVNLDGWIRRKIRTIKLKQLKRRYTIWKFYRNRGLTENNAWLGVLGGKGLWCLSRTPQSHMAMNMAWFKEMGLINLTERWQELGLAAGNRLGA